MNHPSHRQKRAQFPKLKAELGEDPARFLDYPLASDADARRLALARIRGIDTIAKVRAWVAVERQLDRGPRSAIIDRLEKREETLRQIGERPDRLAFGPRLPPESFDSESRAVIEGGDTATATEKLSQMRSAGNGGEKA